MDSPNEGYPQIAELMSNHGELAILRKFNNLSMLNLLHMQAELMHLEQKYYQLSQNDEKYSTRAYRSRDWWSLTQLDGEGKREQWELLLEIREKLKEYHDQISRHTYISSRPKPNPYDLKFFQEWLEDVRGGNFPLRGIDRNAWSEVDHGDHLAIHKRETNDHFSRWFINTLIPQFHNKIGWRFKKPVSPANQHISSYSDSTLLYILDLVGTVIASLLPITSIIVLYIVSSMAARLGILAGFTAMFALCLKLLTGSRRIEIFAATSTYAHFQLLICGCVGCVLERAHWADTMKRGKGVMKAPH